MRQLIVTLIFFIALLLNTPSLFAGVNTFIFNSVTDTTLNPHLDHSDNKDLIDVFHHLFNNHNHPHATPPSSKTGHYHASVVPVAGYTLQTGFAVDLTGNLGFYTSEHEQANLSTITANLAYTQKSQILFPVQTNIWAKGNTYNFSGDWRYYKYPQYTYGLGGYSTTAQTNLLDYSYIRFYEAALKKVGKDFFLGVGYMLDYHWNISEKGNEDGTYSDFQKYGFSTQSVSSGVSLNLLFDNRRNSINPDGGFYANAVLRDNLTLLGSNSSWQSFLVDIRRYVKLNHHNDDVLAFWSYNWFTFNKAPYLDLPSNGWDTYNNTGRGYVQSRFRGKDMMYLESEYRFNISHNQLLGGVLFANAESFTEWGTNRFEKLLPGIGTGIRLQFNKHSRTNIALDYAFGMNGSGGVFVNLGEVF